jgi:EAL domain-containing protein (putative c-di-GMP-specific phosphodiesterase class I)/GGDEF domain-containing protein
MTPDRPRIDARSALVAAVAAVAVLAAVIVGLTWVQTRRTPTVGAAATALVVAAAIVAAATVRIGPPSKEHHRVTGLRPGEDDRHRMRPLGTQPGGAGGALTGEATVMIPGADDYMGREPAGAWRQPAADVRTQPLHGAPWERTTIEMDSRATDQAPTSSPPDNTAQPPKPGAVIANAMIVAGTIALAAVMLLVVVAFWGQVAGPVAIAAVLALGALLVGVVVGVYRWTAAYLEGGHGWPRWRTGTGTATATDLEGPEASRERLVEAMAGSVAGIDRNGLALAFFRLDGLDRINRTLGRNAGTEILTEMQRRLVANADPTDLVGRSSSSTFVVVREHGVGSAEWARALHDKLLAPQVIDGGPTVHPTGIGVLVTTDGFHADGAALLEEAEELARPALLHERHDVGHLHLRLEQHNDDNFAVASSLGSAVTDGDVVAEYQPVIDLRSMEPVGVEALARWTGAPAGAEGPDEFLDLARTLGLHSVILDLILDQVCSEMSRGEAAERGWWASVNLSADDCVDPTLPGRIEAVLERTGLAADRLMLEISERSIPEPAVERSLRNLAAIGVRLAIDDFGSGWSSLAQIRSLPISLLKLDKSLVAEPSLADAQLTMATVALAGALGIDTLAEGVESGEDLLLLCLAECDYGQGFWWSEAAPLDRILKRFPSAPVTDDSPYAEVFDLQAIRDSNVEEGIDLAEHLEHGLRAHSQADDPLIAFLEAQLTDPSEPAVDPNGDVEPR